MKQWFKRLFESARERLYRWFVPPYRTAIVHEHLPESLDKKTLYIVEEDGFEEQAAMICPCGCGLVLHMNLLPDERPRSQFADTFRSAKKVHF
jgi:hypothetical protein